MPDAAPQSPDPLAGIAAAAFPGLGHIIRGRTKRGVLSMIGVMGLFLYGLFIGGIDAVDSRDDKIWFVGAALVGPTAFGVDWIHQNRFKALDPNAPILRTGRPGEIRETQGVESPTWRMATLEEIELGMRPPNQPGLGRLNEIAMLSIALAGMLNFIVFIDALLPDIHRTNKPATIKPKPSTLAAAATPGEGDRP
ncbi:MAG: DUF6677 family protein [Phycisphaerales bacterium]